MATCRWWNNTSKKSETELLRDALHNSLRSAICDQPGRAVCCVVFLANSHAIGKKTALQPIPIRLPQPRQSYAEHPNPEILRTLLVASLVEGHLEIAHYLLAHGADPGLVSELDDLTPLQAAKKLGHEEFVALFLRLGVKEPRRPFGGAGFPFSPN